MSYFYLLLDVLTISFPLAWTWERRMAFYKKLKPLFLGILFANFIFIPWDVWFAATGVWGFNPDYLTGLKFLHLPIEEWLWFFVTPYACFFIFESLVYFVREKQFNHWQKLHWMLAGILAIAAMLSYPRLYTSITFSLAAMFLIISVFSLPNAKWFYFWISYVVCLIPFLIFNGALTGMFTDAPVVWYNNVENLSIRLITIPLEDSMYLLLYMLLIFQVYGRTALKKTR